MIKIDNETKTIYLTKGDAPTPEFNRIAVCLPIYNVSTDEEEYYKFKLSDKLSFVVFEKGGYTKQEVLRLDWTVAELGYPEETVSVEIPLTEEITKIFPQTNKKKIYCYDICLNDTTTILGMDEDGFKKLVIFPEGGED